MLDSRHTGFLSALGLGLLIGVVRERQRVGDGHMPAGMRTHTIAALGGAIAWVLGMPVFLVLLGAVALMAAASYMRGEPSEVGQTGEVTLMVTVLLGAFAQSAPGLAGALAVLVAILLQARERLHRLGRDLISENEMRDGLLLLAAALLILPLLPDASIAPFAAVNPQKVWRLVVLVMAVSALGHIVLRIIGANRGLAVAGFFAGFVSSTAAIAGFGQRVRADATLLRPCVAAAMFAALSSLLLIVPILATVSMSMLQAIKLPMLAFGGVLAIGGVFGLGGGISVNSAPTQESRMFRFSHALYFAAFMTGVLILSRWLSDEYGESGALLTSFFAALAELHASVASLGQLLEQGGISISGVRHAFLGVLGASVISRSIAAWVAGGAAYGVRVAVGLSIAWIAAALTIGFASH